MEVEDTEVVAVLEEVMEVEDQTSAEVIEK
jgi:hypothetical protein